jgi:endoglucanase
MPLDETGLELFRRLLETPSPSGYERPIQDVVRAYLRDCQADISTDLHGNVIGIANAGAPLRLMLAGHCDQIGLMVQYIDSDGFLYVQAIGGWDPVQLIGQRMTIWSQDGPVPGIISRKPAHLLTDEERKQQVKLKDLWIDIGAKNREEAASLVRVGDCITLELGYRELRNDRVYGTAMDDKTGLWVVLEAFRRAVSRGGLKCALYAVSTVQEEIGLRGARTSAYGIDPQVGIAVDVTHATDCPTIDKKQEGEINLGGGPVIYRGPNMNPRVVERLVSLATEKQLPYQMGGLSRPSPTDANSMQLNRAGMAVGLVSLPNRYMHSAVELVSLTDLDAAANLLAEFALSLAADTDFTP